MAVRRLRMKLLIAAAFVITFYALYQRITQEVDKPNHEMSKDAPSKVKVDVVKSDETNSVLHESKDQDDTVLHQQAIAMNFAQKMHNVDRFGQHSENSFILVVQVHDRVQYFKELINSMRNVRDIEKATLVISMDKFSPEIDDAISDITFCRYMTIFFPFSMQLFSSTFPGEDKNDCPRDMSKSEAVSRKCNNAEYPDMYGHYREVKFVQIKHHWLWKLSMIFSGIREFANNKAPAILLEEDYYLAPDILECARKAIDLKEEKCPRCSTVTLGNYEPNQDFSKSDQVEINAWSSTKSNMGMMITKDFYNKIVACMDTICEYDDYNWDWSLQAAASTCIQGNVYTVQMKVTRIYHLGSCGGMHSQTNCDVNEEVVNIKSKLQNDNFFPETLHVALDNPATVSLPRPNGGWGDLRDQTLCKRYKSLCESIHQN